MPLQEKIKKGESRTLEFKVDIPEGNQLSRTAVAFANGAGGEILIGVDDKGNVKGLSEDQINNYPDKIAAIDQIDEGRSEIRNKVISRIFKEFNYIEQWGIGINKIIKSCESYGLKRPQFIEKGGFFSVEIYRDRPNTGRIPTEYRP